MLNQPWITPSVFESTGNDNIVDEFTLGQLLDGQTALTMLNNHWSTVRCLRPLISSSSFVLLLNFSGLQKVTSSRSRQRDLRMSGKRNLLSRWDLLLTINICRIPIGYWSIPLTASDTSTSTSTAPYIKGAWTYFLRALAWAKKHNVRVIVDLHGAPGSQNGYDNSGQLTNNPVWAVNPDNVTRTVDTLKFLAKEVGNQVDVIELLNEAAGFRSDDWAATVRSFWEEAYDAVRQAAGEDVKIMIGDAFLGVNVIFSYRLSTESCTS